MSSRIGVTASHAAFSPPTMKDSLPSRTVTVLPDTGASSIRAPRSATRAARARLAAGLTVLVSM